MASNQINQFRQVSISTQPFVPSSYHGINPLSEFKNDRRARSSRMQLSNSDWYLETCRNLDNHLAT